jgi:hypothetical protein
MEAKDLESCERALILAMNRPDPPPPETIEQVYSDVRAAEAMFGDAGAEVRLKRLEWEITRFRRARKEDHTSKPVSALPVESGRELATARHELPQDLPLQDPFAGPDDLEPVETPRPDLASLSAPTRPPGAEHLSEAAWQRAYVMTEAMIGHHVHTVEARLANPPRDSGPRYLGGVRRRP